MNSTYDDAGSSPASRANLTSEIVTVLAEISARCRITNLKGPPPKLYVEFGPELNLPKTTSVNVDQEYMHYFECADHLDAVNKIRTLQAQALIIKLLEMGLLVLPT